MTRPLSHRDQIPEKRCGNCIFSHLVAYKLDLLCFHGDKIEIDGQSEYPMTADHVYMNDEEVGILDGDEYDKIWAGRIVDRDEVCDEWKLEQ